MRLIPILALAGVSLVLAGAVPADHPGSRTLVFATEGDPTFLDGAIVSDGTSLRIVDQIMETLVDLRPGSTRIVPGLARRWKSSRNGTRWNFFLRRGVRFHDGTPFNAAAVCFNFNRWYTFPKPFQSEDATYYWQTVFGGFKDTVGKRESPEILRKSLFRSCRVLGRYTVQLNLTRASGAFLGGLALKNFGIASPRALRRYNADSGRIDETGQFRYTGTFATRHPTGTGPYRFVSWTLGERVVLARYGRYWGKKAHVARVIFRPIADNAARLQALQTGEVQGYDLVAPQDLGSIRRNRNLRTMDRPAFNVFYVGFNTSKPPMNRPNVRRAVAHGLNRAAMVRVVYQGRGQVATQFQPPSLFGWAANVPKYAFNPNRSRQLLRAAGLQLPVKLDFYYFTRARPYIPDPKTAFEILAASLEQSGFDIEPHVLPFRPDFISATDRGEAGHLRILGWTGDFGDPDNFLGTFFQSPHPSWGFNNPRIHNLLARAEREPSFERRVALYKEANRAIMTFLPGVPIAHSRPALGFRRNVRGFVPSPVTLEPFSLVFYGGGR